MRHRCLHKKGEKLYLLQLRRDKEGIKMKRAKKKFFLMAVLLGAMVLLSASYSAAFETVKLGEETELSVYGFLRNNAGMFLQTPLDPFSKSSNDVATARTWLRGYADFKISNQLRFGTVLQFVYEPPYEVEHGAGGSYRTVIDEENLRYGKEYSEYKNINDILREAYIEWKPASGNSIKFGRQIAIWGEALTTRIGDVIQPEDNRFTLAFANLEDTRIPQWMIRGIHDFQTLNSSFEWILNPNLVQNKYRVNRSAYFISLGMPGERFSLFPETRFDPPFAVTNPALGGPFANPDVVVPNPFSRDWIQAFPGFWVPTALPTAIVRFPHGWKSFRGGFRTNTTLAGYNFGISYFHTQNYDPVVRRGDLTGRILPAGGGVFLPERLYELVYPNIDIIGAYGNKQLPWPGVMRAEMIYVPNKPFQSFDPTISRDLVRRDYIKYMIAYDLNGFFYFPWHKTASFDVTFEHVGEIIPDNQDVQYIGYNTEVKKWNPSFNMRISTNWRYNQIATELIIGYIPWGRSGLIMPAIKYTPPWMNNALSFELKYINVFGKNDFKGLGILRRKDMVVLTSQYNW
jgi:hypothetical protein